MQSCPTSISSRSAKKMSAWTLPRTLTRRYDITLRISDRQAFLARNIFHDYGGDEAIRAFILRTY